MKQIAVIGSGISGLGAAYLLHPHHHVTLYEKEARLGGHARTIDVTHNGMTMPVDTGFIVFNYRNYPHLTGLFATLNVPVQKSDMSLGLSLESGAFEWGCADLNAVFAQRSHLFSPRFWAMIAHIMRFNKNAEAMVLANPHMTLNDLLNALKMNHDFRHRFLLPTAGAIWSSSPDQILDFPAQSFINFFKNHGLLTVNDQPQWYTVSGGSREYVKRIANCFAPEQIRTSSPIAHIIRHDDGVEVRTTTGESTIYDEVVIASHSDQALKMLHQPSAEEQRILSHIPYQTNRAYVHHDPALMPKRTACWASWNYMCDEAIDERARISVTYWMNRLQGIDKRHPIFVTLNPSRPPKEELIVEQTNFEHPVYSMDMLAAQKEMPQIQGVDRIWYCGAYQRYGFHEDGLHSAVEVAKQLGCATPW